jgi:mono/diheme cytochrome c family protein
MIARLLRGAAAGLLAVFLASMVPALRHAAAADSHFADAEDVALVTLGKHVYMGYCASCHGKNLQGQPLWQLDDEFAGRRAPAQDETGHTWQHADEDLFRKTKDGRFPSEPANIVPAMPAFAESLDDHRILAALAFIKARWPLGLRVAQAMLNPEFAGMPAGASDADWRLPPNCNVLLRWQAAIPSR